jgi:hypothetical protein
MRLLHCFILIVITIIFTACTQPNSLPLSPQAFSTNEPDFAYDVAAQGSTVYVAGKTLGPLEGPNQGYDAFIRKYSPTYRWGRQFGNAGPDQAYHIATDSLGNAYVAGETFIGNNPGTEKRVVFLRKYDPNGNLLWTRQFGSFWLSSALDIAVDQNDNVYLASSEYKVGEVYEVFVRKFSPSGDVIRRIKIQPLTSGGLTPQALDIDSLGNIYVLAFSNIIFGPDSLDSFILRYNPSGVLAQSMRVVPGSPSEKEFPFDLKIDQEDQVVISVSLLSGSVPLTSYLMKYRGSDLALRWKRKLTPSSVNSGQSAIIRSIAIEGTTIYIAGSVTGKFPGATSSGVADAFVMKYDSLGSRLWVNQFGSTAISDFDLGTHGVDIAYGTAVSNAVYVVGSTTGKLLSTTAKPTRDEDAFIAQLNKTSGVINWLDQ